MLRLLVPHKLHDALFIDELVDYARTKGPSDKFYFLRSFRDKRVLGRGHLKRAAGKLFAIVVRDRSVGPIAESRPVLDGYKADICMATSACGANIGALGPIH